MRRHQKVDENEYDELENRSYQKKENLLKNLKLTRSVRTVIKDRGLIWITDTFAKDVNSLPNKQRHQIDKKVQKYLQRILVFLKDYLWQTNRIRKNNNLGWKKN